MGAKLLGIEFAPLVVPWKRRLEVIAVVQWIICYLFVGPLCTVFTIYLCFTSLWPVVAVYAAWYIYDRNTHVEGGRRSEYARKLSIWKHFSDYFPIKLVKTCELDPSKNYILGCHPHGIFSTSHFANFATEGTGFSEQFPSIRPHLLVLPGGFRFPIFREYFALGGFCSHEKASLEYLMSKKEGGNAACIVVGGAVESLEAKEDNFRLNLNNKKGFIKAAIKTGASLVPVYSFGENCLYSQATSKRMKQLQEWLTLKMGFTIPLAYGRGIFNYSFGIYPRRKPIASIVGAPIHVEKNEQPTQEQIDALHATYVQKLDELFEAHKLHYQVSGEKHLKTF